MPKRGAENNMEFTNEEILSIINEIRSDSQGPKERARIFRRKYPEFAERFSSLFDMACNPEFDMPCLDSMLKLRERVLSNEMTVDSASKVVGQGLFDKYVKDKTGENP